jgi:hypothetical protein
MPAIQTNDAPGNDPPFNPLPDGVPPEVETDVPVDIPAEGDDETTQPPSPSPEQQAAEAEASKYGWVPKDEWTGAPERWRPASEFLDVRTNILKITRDENAQLRATVAALKARTDAKEQKEAEDRANLQRASLRLELKQAREDQDWDKVDEITEKIFDLKIAASPQPKQETTQTVDPEVKTAFEDFGKANPWLKNDRELAVDFAVELKNIIDLKAATDINDALAQAKRRVIRANPAKFSKGNGRSMTEMNGSPATSTNGRTWADLKPEYRTEQVAEQIKQKKFTLKDYLANCDADCFRR